MATKRFFFVVLTIEDDGTDTMQSRLEEDVRNVAINEFGNLQVHRVTSGELQL